MAVKVEGPSKASVRRIATRPELADGFYAMIPQQITRVETEEKPLRIMLRCSPLKDVEDSNSVDKGYSEFVHLYPDTPNPLNPEMTPYPFMVSQTVDYLQAAFDDLPGKVRFVNRVPVVDGEAIEKSEIDAHNIAAVEATLGRMADLWNEEDLDAVLTYHMVYAKVRRYVKKNGDTGKAIDYYRELPADAQLVAPEDWEFYPEE